MVSSFQQAALLIPLLTGCVAAYRGPPSPHFDGTVFSNPKPVTKSLGDLWRLFTGGPRSVWPKGVPSPISKTPLSPHDDLFLPIGHSSFLIQIAGMRILTDPVFSEFASPFQFAGPRRVRPPGIELSDLPPIDVVLISHDHYDHLDIPGLVALNQRPQQTQPPLIVAGLGVSQTLHKHGLRRTKELDWYDETRLGPLRIWFAPCQHRSGRWVWGHNRTLWGAFVIEAAGRRLYFGGDAGWSDFFAKTQAVWHGFDLAWIPIGAYEPRWFMADVHLNPEDAVRAHLALGSRHSVGMHFGTFQLTYEAIDQPVRDLDLAKRQHHLRGDAFVPAQFGIVRPLPAPKSELTPNQVMQHGRNRPAEWLKPTPMIDSDHPDIVALAKRLASAQLSATQQRVAIHDWVQESIAWSWQPCLDTPRASETLVRGYGHAGAQSGLLVALLRAAGFPARQRFVDLGGEILAPLARRRAPTDHVYTEVYSDQGWIALDAYVLPRRQAEQALERLAAEPKRYAGYGVSRDGCFRWDGHRDCFLQWHHPALKGAEYSNYEDMRQFYAFEPRARQSRGSNVFAPSAAAFAERVRAQLGPPSHLATERTPG